MDLTNNELRVLGCLIEKEATTPDQYPLSLNALTNACNQKSNREPVMDLSEVVVQETVDMLLKKHLLREESGFGSRVAKYRHRFCNTEFSELQLTEQQLSVLCVLMLRGPQTPGELRTRTHRLCGFDDTSAVENVLSRLCDWDGGGLVLRLPREAGKRECRYGQLFGEQKSISDFIGAAPAIANGNTQKSNDDFLSVRLQVLETEVDELRSQLVSLQIRLDELSG